MASDTGSLFYLEQDRVFADHLVLQRRGDRDDHFSAFLSPGELCFAARQGHPAAGGRPEAVDTQFGRKDDVFLVTQVKSILSNAVKDFGDDLIY